MPQEHSCSCEHRASEERNWGLLLSTAGGEDIRGFHAETAEETQNSPRDHSPHQLWGTAQTAAAKVKAFGCHRWGGLHHQHSKITHVCIHYQVTASARQLRGVHSTEIQEPGLLLLRKVETNVIIQINHLMRCNKDSDEGLQLNTI